jgi:hypothetical protein
MAISERTFVTCTLKYLDKTFKTRQVDRLASLDAWFSMTANISDFERQSLLHFQQVLAFNVHDWHEQELDSHFIGPIFTLINFSTSDYNHFEDRDLSAVVDDIRLYGCPDGIVASGRRDPETPYFAFQEYKRRRDPNGDPAGQCLAAMLAGQTLNEDELPLYGCFVIGDLWHFITLEGRQYAVSPGHLATSNDLFDIYRILKALKTIVAGRVAGTIA